MDTTQFPAPESIAPFLTRVLLGILFFIQGYDKIFNVKISNVIETIRPAYQKMKLPGLIITLSALAHFK